MPIRRILLYKGGMAYILQTGEIRSPLSLTFHPEEMNDVLKSFTAWNPDSSTLYAVGYNRYFRNTQSEPNSHLIYPPPRSTCDMP